MYRRSIVEYFCGYFDLMNDGKIALSDKKEVSLLAFPLQYIGHLLVSFCRTFVRSYDMTT
jgi:hypothetical protein